MLWALQFDNDRTLLAIFCDEEIASAYAVDWNVHVPVEHSSVSLVPYQHSLINAPFSRRFVRPDR